MRLREYACSLGFMEDSQPEQIEVGSAVHLSLDELESVDLSFDWTVAPR
jgi:hypothetical protein